MISKFIRYIILNFNNLKIYVTWVLSAPCCPWECWGWACCCWGDPWGTDIVWAGCCWSLVGCTVTEGVREWEAGWLVLVLVEGVPELTPTETPVEALLLEAEVDGGT